MVDIFGETDCITYASANALIYNVAIDGASARLQGASPNCRFVIDMSESLCSMPVCNRGRIILYGKSAIVRIYMVCRVMTQ